ncbi:MAG: shikimate dehydrogenase [Rhodobacteraceae bacterium]|nr:shikimate dehydrogenase [Paracoccaceae bacterium]
MTEKRIPLAAVIGNPVEHSKSPALHSHWLKTHGLLGYFVPMRIERDNLKVVLKNMHKMGFVGASVTAPHKKAVLEIADLVTDRAALMGAANHLIFRENGKIHADNTDGYGFIENLRQGAPGWNPVAGPAAVLGAGGGARAVITSLIEVGVREIRLANRTRTRAEELRAEFGSKITVCDWVQAGNMLEGAATVVNSTALGMLGKPEMRIPLDGLTQGAVVTDLVYAPVITPFLQTAADMGCITVDGLGMLLHQAVPGFERWFGIRPTVDDAARRAILD